MNQKVKKILGLAVVFVILFNTVQISIEKANAGFFDNFLKKMGVVNDATLSPTPEIKNATPYAPTIDYEEAVIRAVETGLNNTWYIIISITKIFNN